MPHPAPRSPGARSWPRWVWAALSAAVVAMLAVGALSVAFFFPGQGSVAPADAVVVLAGADDGRYQLAARLVEEGVAPAYVVSDPDGEHPVSEAACAGIAAPAGAVTYCLRPHPTTTLGEALATEELAQRMGWRRVVVVTNRPHTRRVRGIFGRCTTVEVSVRHIQGVNLRRAPYHLLRELAGWAKFAVGGCAAGEGGQ